MFVDKATVRVKAGDGGNGNVSFRHEKYIDKGGPDGGDGGNGGSIILQASRNENTLVNFRYQKEVRAQAGGPGGKRNKHGKSAPDLIVKLPVGTAVYDVADGSLLADLAEDGQKVLIAKGGKGGFGNAHFISSRRQAPRIAEKGEEGIELDLSLELKMIADVGLVGLPNAGKSTLLSIVSNARPEIANYPFTTLVPNLGVADVDDSSILIADIPGLIEGAAEGKGLGDEFLRHVERTAVLLHLIDVYQEDIAEAYQTIQNELAAYKVDLSAKPQIIALTKIEGLDEDIVADQQSKIKKLAPKGIEVMAISAQSKQGIQTLMRRLRAIVEAERAKIIEEEAAQPSIPVLTLNQDDKAWNITREDSVYTVKGSKIERFAARTDFDSEEGVERIRDIMKKMGIMHGLRREGINPGDTIHIGRFGSFSY